MYEPYEDKKGSFLKRFFSKLRDRWEAFKQELRFGENERNKWVFVFIPIVLILLAALSYTGYVTYTARITEAQSRVMVMEKQVAGLEKDLQETKNSLSKCSAELEKAKKDLDDARREIEKSQKSFDVCFAEKESLSVQIKDMQKNYDELMTKFNTLQSNYKSLECNWAQSKGCLYHIVKSNSVECVVKIGEKYYTIPVGLEVPESQVRVC